MMTHELAVSMLSAPLAAIDRRALSQAWYSALQLSTAKEKPAAHAARGERGSGIRAAAEMQAASKVPERSVWQRSHTRASASLRAVVIPSERRAPRLPFVMRIGRTLLEPSEPGRRTAFRIGRGAERVLVLLHGDGRSARLVALCSPKVRVQVERALAEARFALAARGIVLDVAVAGDAPCS